MMKISLVGSFVQVVGKDLPEYYYDDFKWCQNFFSEELSGDSMKLTDDKLKAVLSKD